MIATVLPVRGQTVSGRLLEDGTDSPIADAVIRMLSESGATVAEVLTDPAGRFQLKAKEAGRYRLQAVRIGYAAAVSRELDLELNETLDVVFRLAVRGVPLEPIRVTASSGLERGRDGFERRRVLGRGVFLTTDSLRKLGARQASDAFESVAGLLVQRGPAFSTPRIMSLQGWGCMVVFLNHGTQVLGFTQSRNSRLRVPGLVPMPIRINSDDSMDAYPIERIRGIEIYREIAEVPEEFRRSVRADLIWPIDNLGGCGIAIIWTDDAW
jgi:hypothetical protein